MKTTLPNYKSVLLVALFILGVGSAAGSVVVTGYQNYWVETCNVYGGSFWCTYNSVLTADVLTGLAIFLLGYLLLAKWLGLLGLRRIALIALTVTLLSILFRLFDYMHVQDINITGENYLNTWYMTLLNWSSGILIALLSSLWLLVPASAFSKVKKKK